MPVDDPKAALVLHLRYFVHKPRVDVQQLQPRNPQAPVIEYQVFFNFIRGVLLQYLHVLLGRVGS